MAPPRSLVVGTAGHIDHGKSALVRALTGTDPDRLKEEKARGITIDLGFAYADLGDCRVAFVDVPGHERFVKNMLAGVTGIDAVVLVVAADESVMPQTREHFDICRLLRVPAGLVAITKSDLADEDMLAVVRLDVRELVAGSFLARAPVVEVSSRTGQGLDRFRTELSALCASARARSGDAPVRLPVDRVFSAKGFGTVVTGTLVSGTLAPDAQLELLPAGVPVKVRGLQGHGTALLQASAGQRVAVNLAGVDAARVTRGDTLATSGSLLATTRIDAVVEVLEGSPAMRHGARLRFHQGTTELLGRVAVARVPASEGAGTREPAAEIGPGRRGAVRLRLERPAVVTRGDRFVLRAYSPAVTVAGGQVIDPDPPRGATRSAAAARRFAVLDPGVDVGVPGGGALDERAAVQMIGERGLSGLTAADLSARIGIAPSRVGALVGRVLASGEAALIADRLIARGVLAGATDALIGAVGQHHANDPLSHGLPREEARRRFFARAPVAVFDHVVSGLVGEGRLSGSERLALTAHRASMSSVEQDAMAKVEAVLDAAGLTPPDAPALARDSGLTAAALDHALRTLLREKRIVKIDTLFFAAGPLRRLVQDMTARKAAGHTSVDVGWFKERYGLTRKHAIPLLEHLDRERVTRRMGESRVLL